LSAGFCHQHLGNFGTVDRGIWPESAIGEPAEDALLLQILDGVTIVVLRYVAERRSINDRSCDEQSKKEGCSMKSFFAGDEEKTLLDRE
jgi:hypothetical protein